MSRGWKAKSTYLPDHGGFGRYMKTSPALQKAMLKIGRRIAATAAATAPKDSGEYAASFEVNPGGLVGLMDKRVGKINQRLTAEVANNARHAAALEFGSGSAAEGTGAGERPQGGYNEAQRILIKAALKHGSGHHGE